MATCIQHNTYIAPICANHIVEPLVAWQLVNPHLEILVMAGLRVRQFVTSITYMAPIKP